MNYVKLGRGKCQVMQSKQPPWRRWAGRLFPALSRSISEFMKCFFSKCIQTEQELLLCLGPETSEHELPLTPPCWPQPRSPLSALPKLCPLSVTPLFFLSPALRLAPKICQLEFLLPEIIGNGLWNGGCLLSVTCLSLICPLLIGGWTWINLTNSSAFLFFPSHLLSLLLFCTIHLPARPLLPLPAQVKKQKYS